MAQSPISKSVISGFSMILDDDAAISPFLSSIGQLCRVVRTKSKKLQCEIQNQISGSQKTFLKHNGTPRKRVPRCRNAIRHCSFSNLKINNFKIIDDLDDDAAISPFWSSIGQLCRVARTKSKKLQCEIQNQISGSSKMFF